MSILYSSNELKFKEDWLNGNVSSLLLVLPVRRARDVLSKWEESEIKDLWELVKNIAELWRMNYFKGNPPKDWIEERIRKLNKNTPYIYSGHSCFAEFYSHKLIPEKYIYYEEHLKNIQLRELFSGIILGEVSEGNIEGANIAYQELERINDIYTKIEQQSLSRRLSEEVIKVESIAESHRKAGAIRGEQKKEEGFSTRESIERIAMRLSKSGREPHELTGLIHKSFSKHVGVGKYKSDFILKNWDF